MSVKVGVIGLNIGGMHVRSLKEIPDAKMIAFADLDAAKAQKFADEHGGNPYNSWEAMLENEKELDAVILATPAQLRLEPIRAIAEKKIALFCEKPPALSLAKAIEIRDIVEAAGILNSVGFMYRWAEGADKMRELIKGRHRLFVRSVVAWPVLDWVAKGHAPKNLYTKAGSGGPLIEQAIHYQDVMRYITGDEPVSVHAIADLGTMHSKEGRDAEETTAYILRHQSGMVSTHVHNWSHRGTVMDIQVVGDEFDVIWHMNHQENKVYGTLDGEKFSQDVSSEYYFDEMVGFIKAVGTGDQSLIRSSYADATKTLAVCEAATNAIASGTEVSIS